MENLIIEGTDYAPTVVLSENGICKIEGKAIPEDAGIMFQPLFDWAKICQADRLFLDVNLYYYNTAVSKQLHDLFTKFENNPKIGEIHINWHYEEGDDEARESGELYSDLLERTNFSYIEYAEA